MKLTDLEILTEREQQQQQPKATTNSCGKFVENILREKQMSIGTGIRIHSFNQPVTTAFYYINRPNVALTNNNKSCLQINLDVREKVQSIAKTAKKPTRERTFFFFVATKSAKHKSQKETKVESEEG